MKRVKTLLVIVFASIIVQVMILRILDRHYLVDNYKFEVTYLENEGSKVNERLNNTLETKDNNYVISYNEKLIKICDKRNNSENYITPEDGKKFDNVKLSDNDKELLIEEKKIEKDEVKSYSYDIYRNIVTSTK